jgi:hypothetical protein
LDADSGNLVALPEEGIELIGLCNGQTTLKQIVQKLTDKYHARFESIEQDSITFLQALAQQNFIEV